MFRFCLIVLVFLSGNGLFSQSATFGDSADLYLGEETIFFFGGDASLNGPLNSSGTLVSFSDIDLGTNRDIGNIKFTGSNDQTLYGDTLQTGDFIIDKQGRLILMTAQITVTGEFNTQNGVVETQKDDDILVSGTTSTNGEGFVTGKLFGISRGVPMIFPMGVNGFKNYITISDVPDQAGINVECVIPNPDSLLRGEDIIGISDDVEWIVKSSSDSVEVKVTIDYSGIDWNTLANDTTINSRKYAAALVVLTESDTVYNALIGNGEEVDRGLIPNAEGRLASDGSVWITPGGTKLALAFIPIIDGQNYLIPDVFSPSDFIAENQVFRVFYAGASVQELTIEVYDSFNKQVYSVNDSGDDLDLSLYGWNGILNSGLEAPEGVYYYKVRILPSEGEAVSETGSVLLVR